MTHRLPRPTSPLRDGRKKRGASKTPEVAAERHKSLSPTKTPSPFLIPGNGSLKGWVSWTAASPTSPPPLPWSIRAASRKSCGLNALCKAAPFFLHAPSLLHPRTARLLPQRQRRASSTASLGALSPFPTPYPRSQAAPPSNPTPLPAPSLRVVAAAWGGGRASKLTRSLPLTSAQRLQSPELDRAPDSLALLPPGEQSGAEASSGGGCCNKSPIWWPSSC